MEAHSKRPKLPEDVMTSIFTYVQPHEVLSGRALSDARTMVTLSDIPAATKTIEQVIELDTTPPIRDLLPCRDAVLSPLEIKYIISKARKLRKLRVSHIPGNCFIPLLKHVEDIEFVDSDDVDITDIAPHLHTVSIHDPKESTLQILADEGRCLKHVTFIAVECTHLCTLLEVLNKWSNNLASVTVLFKEPLPHMKPELSDLAMQELATFLVSKGTQYFTALKTIRLGRYDDINSELDFELLLQVKQLLSSFEDSQFLCYRSPFPGPLEVEYIDIPQKITSYVRDMHSTALVSPDAYRKVQQLILLGIENICHRSSDNRYRPEIASVAHVMKEVQHLSIRLAVVMKEAAINCDVFNFIRFFLGASKSVTLLEVTKDFILLPLMCKDMAEMLFRTMNNIRKLVVTCKPRKVHRCHQGCDKDTRNKTVAKALPVFLETVQQHCPLLECLFLCDCGDINLTLISESVVRKDLSKAKIALAKFEKRNPRTDISSVKTQIETWLRAPKPQAS